MRAYGACIFLLSINEKDEQRVSLLASGPTQISHIASLRTVCGCVRRRTDRQIQKLFTKTYVANRVLDIQRLTDIGSWYHVYSAKNPADLISRGVLPSKLLNSDIWWHGPHWLLQEGNFTKNQLDLSSVNF